MVEHGVLGAGGDKLSGTSSGHNETFEGTVYLGTREPVNCYVKLMEPEKVGCELLCAELVRRLGLNVPQGYLVRVYKNDYPQANWFKNNQDEYALGYGTEALPWPTLYQVLADAGCPEPPMLRSVWADWPAMMVFDEWVGNSGRNFQDALLDKSCQGWFIDHEQAFFGRDWKIMRLREHHYMTNQLAEKLGKDLPTQELASVLRQVEIAISKINDLNVGAAIEYCGVNAFISPEDVDTMRAFLQRRKSLLITNITTRLGK